MLVSTWIDQVYNVVAVATTNGEERSVLNLKAGELVGSQICFPSRENLKCNETTPSSLNVAHSLKSWSMLFMAQYLNDVSGKSVLHCQWIPEEKILLPD